MERTALLCILGLAFFLRVVDLGRDSLWYDEILQAQVAAGNLATFIPQLELHAAMPLDYIIARGILALGASEFLLRFPAAASSTVAVAVLYRVGRLYFGGGAGVVAAAFLAVSSFAVTYAHEARPYTLYLLLTLASFYWLYRALARNRLPHWALYALFCAAALATHLFTFFVIAAQMLFVGIGLVVRLVAPQRAQLFARIRPWMVAAVIAAALVLFLLVTFTPNLRFVPGSAQRFIAFLIELDFSPPERLYGIAPGESPPQLTPDYLYTRVLENFSGGGTPATYTLVALAVCGLAAVRRKPWETLLVVIWLFIPVTLVILFLLHRATLFAARYLIASLPALLLLCALGALSLGEAASHLLGGRTAVRRIVVALIALVWLGVALERVSVIIAAPKEDWRAAGKFLQANLQAGDAVIAPGGNRVVYYYAPDARLRDVPAELVEQIADVENHRRRVWLVYTRYGFDPGDTIKSWLQERGALELRVDRAIRLYYWRAGADLNALMQDARALELPDRSEPYVSLGDQFAAHDDHAAAAEYYASALARAQTKVQAAQVNTAWGESVRRAGDAEDAITYYTSALALDRSQVTAWIGLARVYLEQGQLQAAHDALQEALARDPNSYAGLLFLAEYYDRSGQPAAARAALERAAEIIPELTLPP
jgi:tetratricopeptide (TPR) repeat protein